ncbi:putative beta-D-xylosidase [Hibiscus syriacus]|uniref:Beta-D-xylosidase n=1 Tax=Hibiscus syriacus TaxID=106335 RepID=A0A6A2ZPJ5_HIBSY|nr:putative beta-D-xylosidase [Hibiscus syriacus]
MESRGKTSERNSNLGRSKSKRGKSRTGKKDFTCYNYGKNGHFKMDCRALKKDTGAQESANMTEETCDAVILSVNSPIESWILDSGAYFHFTPCQEIMENYISGQLDGEGYNTIFSCCEWKITKGALVIARDKKTDTLYVTSNLENIIAAADADGKSNLWHQRLGHMSEKGMKTLLSKGKLSDLKNVHVELCEDCIFGKQKKKWKAMVENETGLKVKRLRSDNGGEYRNSRFRDFCANNGIKMETTVPMTPQQNGVAERINRTLNERGRSMRIHDGLPKLLWSEAINTAVYLINRGPSVPLDGGIPEGVWSRKEINISHLRVFGCISYVHINSTERSKLDTKSNKCVFVGYGGDEFDYWFWDYENRKINRSRDVILHKNVMYKDKATLKSSSSNTEAETNEFAEFEEISENDVQIRPEAVQEESDTPKLRCSSRIPKPTQRYSSSLHYLLLTDNGEPECYDEAMQLNYHQTRKCYTTSGFTGSKKSTMGANTTKQDWLSKAFNKKKGIDYNEIFSPVVKLSTIRLVLKIVATENLYLEQLDVKTTFLHGDLEEEIYMRQPEGFIEADKKNLVCRLKKSLYGLKQSPRQWYKKFDSFMGSNGFTRCQADHCCYIKKFDNSFIILLLFNMQDAKPVSTPLGIHFRLSKEQSPKMKEERAHMVNVSYASVIGSLIYAIVCTRPDIAHAVELLVGTCIIRARWRYDTDLAGNVDSRMSTTGYVYTLGASKEMVWLQSFLEELGKKQENNGLYYDSQSVIHLAKNSSFHSRTKHIQLRYHFIRSLLEDEILKLEKISGAQNSADMLTKKENYLLLGYFPTDVDSALENTLMVQMRLSMYDGEPSAQPFGNLGSKDVCIPSHQELALEAARQGIVLLKNRGPSLPLSHRRHRVIAVIGPNSNATVTMIGNYAGPTVLVLMSGGPIVVSFAKNDPCIAAIVWAGYPGQADGAAITDVFYGTTNPEGKLPMTWYPEDYVSNFPMTDMAMRYTNFVETIAGAPKVVAVHLDCRHHSGNTTVSGKAIKVNHTKCNKLSVGLQVDVKNTGSKDGSHTMLVFSTPPAGSWEPRKQLVAFTKVHVPARSQQRVGLDIHVCKFLSVVDRSGIRRIPIGVHHLHIGNVKHSVSLEAATLGVVRD